MKDHLAYARGLLRGNRYRDPKMANTPDAGHPPVLVLHGFLGTRGAMYLVERRLLEDGFLAISYPLGTLNMGSVVRSAERVGERIEGLLESAGVDRLDVIAHSMGGLIGLYYIRHLGGHERVRRMVALGTPFSGTWVAAIGVLTLGLLSPGTWQMLPGHPLQKKIISGALPDSVRFYSVRGLHDRVCPMRRTHLPGARNLILPCDHVGLVQTRLAYEAIKGCLLEP